MAVRSSCWQCWRRALPPPAVRNPKTRSIAPPTRQIATGSVVATSNASTLGTTWPGVPTDAETRHAATSDE